MVKTILMPNDEVRNGTILRWMKTDGEKFEKGELLLEVETTKTIVQVDAPESGTILRILAKEGTSVIARSPLALYGVEGEEVPPELLKPPSPSTIFIKLLDERSKLVTAASVEVDGKKLALTAEGEFTIDGLPPGTYTLNVRAIGFLEKVFFLKVGEGEISRHDLTLVSSGKES